MSLPNTPPQPPDPSLEWDTYQFIINRNRMTLEELAPYIDKHVALSMDGSRILASADDLEGLEKALIAAGIDPCHTVFDYVSDPNVSEV
jgi:hypothetical protein